MIFKKNFIHITLNTNINTINKNNIIFLYVIYLILVISISIIFYSQFILLHPDILSVDGNINYKNIPFEYGPLTENLINKQKYFDQINLMGEPVDFYLSRMPILPYLFLLSSFFSSKLFFFIIFKNIIFFSIIFFSTLNFAYEKKYNLFSFLIIMLIFFYNPYNLKIITNFVYADFITSTMIPILFLISVSNFKYKDYCLGLLIFTLYLTKTSMMFICIFISIYFLLVEKKKIPIFFLLIAIISWGTFGYVKTNKFPFAQSMLSTNSHALAISLNENFNKFYPLISVDYIPHCNLRANKKENCAFIPEKIENEWDYYNFYKKINSEYIKKNQNIFFNNLILKLKTIFFNFYEDGQVYKKNQQPEKKFQYSVFLNKLIFILAIIVVLRSIIKNFEISKNKLEILFLTILISSLPAYLVGWALNRHLVYLFLISHIYLFLKFKSE